MSTGKVISKNDIRKIILDELTSSRRLVIEKKFPKLNKEFYIGDEVVVDFEDEDEFIPGVITKFHPPPGNEIDVEINFPDGTYETATKIRPKWVYLPGEQPDNTGSSEDKKKDAVKDQVKISKECADSASAWEALEATAIGKTLKREMAQFVLEQFGVKSKNPGIISTTVASIFANTSLGKLSCYFTNSHGPDLFASLIVDTAATVLTSEGVKEPLQKFLGLKSGVGISDTILTTFTFAIAGMLSDSKTGTDIKKGLSSLFKDWLQIDLMATLNSAYDQAMESGLSDLSETLEEAISSLTSWLGSFIKESPLVRSSKNNISELTLSRSALREIILNECRKLDQIHERSILNKNSILLSSSLKEQQRLNSLNEGTAPGLLLPLILSVLALPAAVATGAYIFSDEIFDLLDNTPIGKTIKGSFAEYLLEKIGNDPVGTGLVGRLLPPVIMSLKLGDIDKYLDDATGPDMLADIIVDSLVQVLAKEGVKMIQELLGITDSTSKIGSIILTYISAVIAVELQKEETLATLKRDTAGFIRDFDVNAAIEDVKRDAGSLGKYAIAITQTIMGK
jgi:hypothetical protein